MNKSYKFKSLQFQQEGDAAEQGTTKIDEQLVVFTTGETQTINFIQKDGTQQNFPYSHYLTSWLGRENQEIVLKIFFATHLVTIHGVRLDELYRHLIQYKVKSITEHNARYIEGMSEDLTFVTGLEITWKNVETIRES